MNSTATRLQDSNSPPADVRALLESERDALIVSTTVIDGQARVLSRYGDGIWLLTGFTRISIASIMRIDYSRVPESFRGSLKAVLYRYLMRGRAGKKPPKGPGICRLFDDARSFLVFVARLGISNLGSITPMICSHYVSECKQRVARYKNGKLLSQASLQKRFIAVEALWELSQYTEDPIPRHPWLGSSSHALSGVSTTTIMKGKTPLIPDDVFCSLFQAAYAQVKEGAQLLDVRDALHTAESAEGGKSKQALQDARARLLKRLGVAGGLAVFNGKLLDLRTACYTVIASTSGVRVHEAANLESGAHFTTEDEEGLVYHWMRAESEKTDAGLHDWMIPEAAVLALQVMERWAIPYQSKLRSEINARRLADSSDVEIARALDHGKALFVGTTFWQDSQVRTLSTQSWNKALKDFAEDRGIDWPLATHQFRRKFANYAAHSRFGDLRYLREHYAHWTMDMALGYAMDRDWALQYDAELYEEVQAELQDIKISVADKWLQGQEPLAGSYGKAIQRWKRDPRNLAIFKDHKSMVASIAESTAIRSNGHAWCTADDDRCVGNTLERTRCSGCNNAVIGRIHAGIYKRLIEDLQTLLELPDIGPGGRLRVMRDIERCRSVLIDLGYDPDSEGAAAPKMKVGA